VIPDNCNNLCFIIYSKTIEEAVVKLKKEIEALTKLGNDYVDLQGEVGNWMNGVTLIRDDHFLQHAMAIAADQVDLDSWPLKFIDWDMAAKDLKKRYMSIIYNGVTYWVKK